VKLIPDTWTAWPPKDQRAMVALLASWGGTVILTAALLVLALNLDNYADRLIDSLIAAVAKPAAAPTEELKALATVLKIVVEAMKWLLVGLLVIVGLVLIGLGMAINRREVEASLGKWARFKTSGGDDGRTDQETPPKVRTVTETEVIPGHEGLQEPPGEER
jgi:hypothetical protein